ncbi:hypothetical protein AgCh_016717 [Apium graveolens]
MKKEELLEKMGFDDKWGLWICNYLKSDRISVLVSGSPVVEFASSRGSNPGPRSSPSQDPIQDQDHPAREDPGGPNLARDQPRSKVRQAQLMDQDPPSPRAVKGRDPGLGQNQDLDHLPARIQPRTWIISQPGSNSGPGSSPSQDPTQDQDHPAREDLGAPYKRMHTPQLANEGVPFGCSEGGPCLDTCMRSTQARRPPPPTTNDPNLEVPTPKPYLWAIYTPKGERFGDSYSYIGGAAGTKPPSGIVLQIPNNSNTSFTPRRSRNGIRRTLPAHRRYIERYIVELINKVPQIIAAAYSMAARFIKETDVLQAMRMTRNGGSRSKTSDDRPEGGYHQEKKFKQSQQAQQTNVVQNTPIFQRLGPKTESKSDPGPTRQPREPRKEPDLTPLNRTREEIQTEIKGKP